MHSIKFFKLFGLISLTEALIVPRAAAPVCKDLRVSANNGDRKVALVIDSSGSMASSDPLRYRITAAKDALDFLISKAEATDGKKEDAVAVIQFDQTATLDFPLGDPGTASSSMDGIDADGGTYIAGGVELAISQLTADGTGETSGRSGILVFTDGEDSDTTALVDQINKAKAAGIRVAFGFLDSTSSLQDQTVLSAIMNSGGRYFTIPDSTDSKQFINGIIVNGLTTNDNPKGDTNTLFSGLDASHYISGSETQAMTYMARNKERLTFKVQSVNAGNLNAQVVVGGKSVATSKITAGKYSYGSSMSYVATKDGAIDVKVAATNAVKDSIFVVGVTSNLPPINCTVAVGDPPKPLATWIGGGIGGFAGIAFLGGSAYMLYKYYGAKTLVGHGSVTTTNAPPAYSGAEKEIPATVVKGIEVSSAPALSWFKFPTLPPPAKPPAKTNNPQQEKEQDEQDDSMTEDSASDVSEDEDNSDPSQDASNQPTDHHRRPKLRRTKTYSNNHHHHLPVEHPCYVENCAIATHTCEDTNHACTCVDPKCKLNSRKHRCKDEILFHICEGPEGTPNCPLDDPEYAKLKKQERDEFVRKYTAQDIAKAGAKQIAKQAVRAATGM
ncbi:hypothetical protein BT63DRAFT_453312 [Microthyrium microscopicum]|uniref:VWFA domain-containing protein n=1 Tax=Microthyrium microscopicum TaxID=703497 RepID=A0A6A6UHA9_9PEZI|nr:hypothetical protein BT63DRAFT_453312 [Microthyrium microscopicum]